MILHHIMLYKPKSGWRRTCPGTSARTTVSWRTCFNYMLLVLLLVLLLLVVVVVVEYGLLLVVAFKYVSYNMLA